MTLAVLLVVLALHAQEPALPIRISELVQVVLMGEVREAAAAYADARTIYRDRGLPTVAEVGDEAAYSFVVLMCTQTESVDRGELLARVKRAASRGQLPADASEYCEARIRIDLVRSRAQRQPPTHPALRDEILRMVAADQAARQRADFDAKKTTEVDRDHRAALAAIVEKHGVPTYDMVGPDAASGFVTMVQHQNREFRRKVLPGLRANVDVGQADPGSYTKVYDRTARDEGRPQLYGEILECSPDRPTLHRAPIQDEANVNRRRARLGLIRLEMYERLVIEFSPADCAAAR